MKATRFPEANVMLTAPPGQEDVYDLPVWSDGSRCISCWQPTEEERAAIARGEPVWLWVIGSTHPPVAVEARSPFVAPADDAAKEVPTSSEIDAALRRMVES